VKSSNWTPAFAGVTTCYPTGWLRFPHHWANADLSATRADTAPKVFTRIHVHFTVTGEALDPRRVEQAVHLSAKKYCSASIMLGKVAEITHDFEVVEG
jgi:uncharacterized OsmC-like protein